MYCNSLQHYLFCIDQRLTRQRYLKLRISILKKVLHTFFFFLIRYCFIPSVGQNLMQSWKADPEVDLRAQQAVGFPALRQRHQQYCRCWKPEILHSPDKLTRRKVCLSKSRPVFQGTLVNTDTFQFWQNGGLWQKRTRFTGGLLGSFVPGKITDPSEVA